MNGRLIQMPDYTIVWEEALREIRKNLPNFHFATFFQNRQPFFEENGVYYFEVSNAQEKKLMEQKYYDRVIQALQIALTALGGSPGHVDAVYMTPVEAEDFKQNYRAGIIVSPTDVPDYEDYEEMEPDTYEDKETEIPCNPDSGEYNVVSEISETGTSEMISLNPAYTFSSFVVGDSNRFAHAAATAVAESPGARYNPLFLYGRAGLGKTHLMHAIGNELHRTHPEMRIIYVTSETFTNELIDMIGSGRNRDKKQDFRNKYRKADVLMIDDIQFIAGKDTTQAEFFHTFNELHSAGKQIIISSDRPPRELKELEERMRSRFEMGMTADIKVPDYETRVAILTRKASERPDLPPIDEEALHYIAQMQHDNIRSLEGSLQRLSGYAAINRTPRINKAIAETALKDYFGSDNTRTLEATDVCELVCSFYKVEEKDLLGPRRLRELVRPRQIAMFILREIGGMTLQAIGEHFHRDHTTVMSAIRAVEKNMKEDKTFKTEVDDLIAKLRNT